MSGNGRKAKASGYGRVANAPCGHRGEALVGHYYRCLEGCEPGADESDGVPVHIDPERTQPLCSHCKSDEVEPYKGFFMPNGEQVYHCNNCGQSFAS